MTRYPEIWNALVAEFPPGLVRDRPAGGGRVVSYITARTAANRLDDVLGFENWEDEYEHDPGGGDNITCKLTITLPGGEKVTKCDNGSPGSTGDDGEDEKGAFSDAFKRAAAKFGVGRYLYGEGVYRCPVEGRPATAPRLAEPAGSGSAPDPAPSPSPTAPPHHVKERGKWGNSQGQTSNTTAPRSGRALFAWAREQETRHGVGVVKYLGAWGKQNEMPGRMVDWTEEQARLGHDEAVRKLATLPADRGDAYDEEAIAS